MTRAWTQCTTLARVFAAGVICACLAAGNNGCENKPAAAPAEATRSAVPLERTQHLASGDAFLDVATSVDRTDLTVADRVRLSIVCTTRRGATLTLPELTGQIGDLSVVSSAKQDRTLDSKRRRMTLDVVLEPFLSGQKTLPAMTVQAEDGDAPLKITIDPITLHVSPVADDKADANTSLEGPKAPVDYVVPAKPNRTALLVTLLCSMIGVAGALGFAIFTASRRARRESSAVFQVRRSLDAVKNTLAGSSTVPEAAVACEALFRAFAPYLSRMFAIPADTQPHAQIAPLLLTCDRLSLADRNELNALLIDMERARFAPDGVSVPIVRGLLDRASALVDRTAAMEALA